MGAQQSGRHDLPDGTNETTGVPFPGKTPAYLRRNIQDALETSVFYISGEATATVPATKPPPQPTATWHAPDRQAQASQAETAVILL
jgi:hypothetical protein